GILDSKDVIYRVRSRLDPDQRKLATDDMIADDTVEIQGKRESRWLKEGKLKDKGQFIRLTAKLAREQGIVTLVVDKTEDDSQESQLREICTFYGMKYEDLKRADRTWLEAVAEFLRHPVVTVFLVMIGIIGLILELKMPGIGFPGVIAAICFVLFFWA